MAENKRPSSQRRRVMADRFTEKVAKRESLRLRAQRHKDETVWFGLGMIGIVGWSVAIPTLIGIAIGLWIDENWPTQYSWTLMLLVLGVIVGSINAGYWVKKARIGIIKDE